VLNLGLQGVALARETMIEEDYEKQMKRCNGMSVVRKVAEIREQVVELGSGRERDVRRGDDGQRQEQKDDDYLLEIIHYDYERDLEKENVLLRVTD